VHHRAFRHAIETEIIVPYEDGNIDVEQVDQTRARRHRYATRGPVRIVGLYSPQRELAGRPLLRSTGGGPHPPAQRIARALWNEAIVCRMRLGAPDCPRAPCHPCWPLRGAPNTLKKALTELVQRRFGEDGIVAERDRPVVLAIGSSSRLGRPNGR
jgi:hypothetical protein